MVAKGIGSVVSMASCILALYAEEKKMPNVVLILADDLGYGDIGCYGQQRISTPHIDALAHEGVRFTQFYAGASVSAPSRASLMTGLHTGHTHIRGNREVQPEGQLPLGPAHTIAQLYAEAGYRTGLFGKWGLGYPGSGSEPLDKGFDSFVGYNCQRQAHYHYPEHLWQGRQYLPLAGNADDGRAIYAPDLIHQHAKDFITEASVQGRPFFAMLAYTLPHAELNLPHDSVYHSYRARLEPLSWTSRGAWDYPSTEDAHASFAAMVSRLDHYVGDLRRLLSHLGIDRETIIIFTSDNGPHREGGADPAYFDSNGPLRGTKRDLYEGGIRVPMIAHFPASLPRGIEITSPCTQWDLYPTFAALLEHYTSRTRATNASDGVSLLPLLLDQGEIDRDRELYWEFHEEKGKQAIRRGKWKLIALGVNTDKPRYELYNLENDLGETYDLAAQHPALVIELQQAMARLRTPSTLFPFATDARATY